MFHQSARALLVCRLARPIRNPEAQAIMDDMSHEAEHIESMLDFEDTLAQQAELEAELWTQELGA